MSSENNRLRLRLASQDEAPLLSSIHEECFSTYWDRMAFDDFFRVMNTYAILAEMQELAGLAVFRPLLSQCDLITLCVRPAFRRRGVARALMAEIMARAVAAGARDMFLDVEDGNEAALRLYEGLGFIQISRRKLYYRHRDGHYVDGLVMTRKLPVASC